jgi:hypothetical protein
VQVGWWVMVWVGGGGWLWVVMGGVLLWLGLKISHFIILDSFSLFFPLLSIFSATYKLSDYPNSLKYS